MHVLDHVRWNHQDWLAGDLSVLVGRDPATAGVKSN